MKILPHASVMYSICKAVYYGTCGLLMICAAVAIALSFYG